MGKAMTMNPYVCFKGDCEAAFKYYEQHLGGEMGGIFRYGGTQLSGSVPEGWPDKIMHGSITIGGQTLQAADVSPGQYEAPKGFSLTLQIKRTADAERIFEAMADGGQVRMPLEKTFWAERFGMVVDRFGVPWIVNCEG
jgi:PhnB protein